MTLRWLIRGSAIALLTLCLSLWGWSYFHSFLFYCGSLLGKSYEVETYMGGAFFGYDSFATPSSARRFEYHRNAYPWSGYPVDKWFLGFTYYEPPYMSYTPGMCFRIGIPFWFPSLLSAGLLWFVWWQTRPKSAWRGFPVEVTQPK